MRVELLVPDVPPVTQPAPAAHADAFAAIIDDLGSIFASAQHAEDAFAAGHGDLQSAVYERARADVALSVATAAAQRTAQSLQTILSLQV